MPLDPEEWSPRDVSPINERTLEETIWIMAPAWIGGDPNDVEVREIIRLARRIDRRLHHRRYQIETSELAAAAIHEYYST
jgi:hypothetical protein